VVDKELEQVILYTWTAAVDTEDEPVWSSLY